MKKISTKTVVILSCVLFGAAGLAYTLLAPKIYSSKSHIAIFRLKIENPDYNSYESSNRWIWVRDGLTLKSAIVTDAVVEKIALTDETAAQMVKNFPNQHLFYEHIKNFINIQFTGADENNFLVEVKAPTAKLAYALNSIVFDRIKYLATSADQQHFEELITEIRRKQQEIKSDSVAYAFYEDKLRKMTFNHLVEQKQKESAIEVISYPTMNDQPIWPRSKLIIIVFLVLGAVFGFFADFVLKNTQRDK
jgi:uncharacterized protein involved in exopolysaccharide biosynthesis